MADWQADILRQLRDRYSQKGEIRGCVPKRLHEGKFATSALRLAQKGKIRITGEDEVFIFVELIV